MSEPHPLITHEVANEIAYQLSMLLGVSQIVLLFRNADDEEILCLTSLDSAGSLKVAKEYIGYEDNLEEFEVTKLE